MTPFKDLTPADMLERAVEAFLRKWLGTYLSEVAEQNGRPRDSIKTPQLWLRTPALTTVTIEQLRYPAMLIVSSGLAERPKRRGDGSYDVRYTLGITSLTHASTEDAATDLSRRYARAVQGAMLQKPGRIGPFIDGMDWIDERFTDYLNSEQESVSSATSIFNAGMKGVLTAKAGPDVPDPLPEPAVAPAEEYPEVPTLADKDHIGIDTEPLEGGP